MDAGTSPTALIADMKSSVIQIAYKADLQAGPSSGVAGTGFLVSKEGYALTAAHVITKTVQQLQANNARSVQFIAGIALDPSSTPPVTFRGSFVRVPCVVVDMDEPHDIALLKLDRNPFAGEIRSGIQIGDKELPVRVQAAKLQTEMPPERTELLVSGYPLDVPTMVTQRGIVASRSFTRVEVQGRGAPPWLKIPEVADLLFADIVVNPGNSGGPFYLSHSGAVIGICHGNVNSPVHWPDGTPLVRQRGNSLEALMQNAGLAVVLPIKYATDLLDKHKIPYLR